MQQAMIDFREVGKCYGEDWAVQQMSFEIIAGERLALIGPSGCGKTTLLRLANGLIEPTKGEIHVDGEQLTSQTRQSLRHHMGYMVQGGGLFPHLTVRDNVTIVAQQLKWSSARIAQRFEELIELVHLDMTQADRFPAQLSGGQQQRVALMRALFLDPKIILLDEPMGALDPLIRADLQTELREIFVSLQKTMMLVTHDISEAGFLADRLVLLRGGRLEQRGTLEDLVRRPQSDFVSRFINAQRSPLESLREGT